MLKLMAYRSSRIRPAPGTVILPHSGGSSKTRRLWNAAADVASLAIVAAGGRKTVNILGSSVPLHYEFARWTWRTERCVEIALGKRAVEGRNPSDVLEVGNVLPLAGVSGHHVLDKYEAGPGIINVDIVDFSPGRTYDLVVSLSTLEHVGWDEIPQDPDKAGKALEVMGGLGRDLLVTIPVGYHRKLESDFLKGPFDSVSLLVKKSRTARWVERPLEERETVQYGSPFACGNAVLVGIRGAIGNPNHR